MYHAVVYLGKTSVKNNLRKLSQISSSAHSNIKNQYCRVCHNDVPIHLPHSKCVSEWGNNLLILIWLLKRYLVTDKRKQHCKLPLSPQWQGGFLSSERGPRIYVVCYNYYWQCNDFSYFAHAACLHYKQHHWNNI